MTATEVLHRFETDLGPRCVRVRRDRRARRLTLRVDARDTSIVITVPPWTPTSEVEDMVRARAAWIHDRLVELGPQVPFAPGERIPVHGIERTLIQAPGLRGRVTLTDVTMSIPGDAAHFARRVRDWLKAEARRAIEPCADETARRAGLRRGRIAVRDTRSRWGSCAHDGGLSFSWRLIMAPTYVLDYVVAHEVAHLAERNHGPEFWAVCDALTPHRDVAEAWLVDNGTRLHRFG